MKPSLKAALVTAIEKGQVHSEEIPVSIRARLLKLPGDDLHSRLRRTSVNLTTLTILTKLNNSRPRVPAAADELLFSGGFLAHKVHLLYP